MKKSSLILLLSLAGALSVGYGMLKNKDHVFVAGIVLVIGGYLLVRKNLKASAGKKPDCATDNPDKKP
jgi:hypothetical protein